MDQSLWPLSLGESPRHPRGMHSQAGLQSFSGGQSAPQLTPSAYAPVGVGGWHLPGLDALQGALALYHHAQVGIPVGVVALGLCGAVRPTSPTCGEQPVNCAQEEKQSIHLVWPSFLDGLSGLSLSCLLRHSKPAFQDDTNVRARDTAQRTAVEEIL